jgi:hypothetical protein
MKPPPPVLLGARGMTATGFASGSRISGGWAGSRIVRPGRSRRSSHGETAEERRRVDLHARRDQLRDDLAQLAGAPAAGRVERDAEVGAVAQDSPDPPGALRLRPVLDEHPHPVGPRALDHADEVDRAENLRRQRIGGPVGGCPVDSPVAPL